MSRNRLLVGGLVIVAAILIAYFAFMYPPVSKEDTSGAIGVAKKYRTEQITDRDVILKEDEAAAAAAFAMMSPEAKAEMFERTTEDLKVRAVALSRDVTAAVLDRLDNAGLARIFRGLSAKDQVAVIERASGPVLQAVSKALGISSQAFNQLSADEKFKRLEKVSDPDLAAVVRTSDPLQKQQFVQRTDAGSQNAIVRALNSSEKAAVLEHASVKTLEALDRAYTEMGKAPREGE
jgi:Mg/Co/Ni transporter MgtE